MINRLLLFFCITVIATTFSSCSIDGKRLAIFNQETSKEITISDFSQIRLSGFMSIVYTTGIPSLKIVAPSQVIDDIKVSNVDGKLDISISESYSSNMHFTGDMEITVYVSSLKFNKAEINGAGRIIIETPIINNDVSLAVNGAGYIVAKEDIICNSNLKCTLNGTGYININAVTANDIHSNIEGVGKIDIKKIKATGVSCSIKGTGQVTLEGKTKTSIFEVENIGKINASNLSSLRTIATMNGVGTIDCNTSEELITSIKGLGKINDSGNPKIVNRQK